MGPTYGASSALWLEVVELQPPVLLAARRLSGASSALCPRARSPSSQPYSFPLGKYDNPNAMEIRGKRIILVALVSAREKEPDSALHAPEQAVSTAGGQVVGRLIQRRGVSRDRRPGGAERMDRPMSAATLIGKGKADELAELCRDTSADLVVFENPLSGTQQGNLAELCAVPVIDYRAL